jgi:hypothetical protein
VSHDSIPVFAVCHAETNRSPDCPLNEQRRKEIRWTRKPKINFWYVIIAVLGVLLAQSLYTQYTKVEPIPFSRFHTLLDEGEIAEIAITENHTSRNT